MPSPSISQIAQSFFGLCVFYLIAYSISENRKAANLNILWIGIATQLAIATLLLKLTWINQAFVHLNRAVLALQSASEAGTSFVFGYLGGGPLPFEQTQPGASFVLAFRALPLVILISALTTLLMHWRILPCIVRAISLALEKGLQVGGAIGLASAANIFVGMTEAPLFIRPYIKQLTRSELFVLMCTGMATIAGTVLILYATVLEETVPDAVAHLLIASIISVPAAITIAFLLVPEIEPVTSGHRMPESEVENSMDAIATGTQRGLQLFFNITAMLFVLVSMVYLANAILGLLPASGGEPITLQQLLGNLMTPAVWLMGIPWQESQSAGSLMGIKTILNELLAYIELANIPSDIISERSRLIMTYALCGFANFGSLGILIGGLTTMAPERRGEIISLGLKSIVGGTLATCCTGAVVGILS